ncbi:MAG: hypothetical protein JSW35_10540 [Deltaproteobacteria bacterium]|nr:MAG: hypothetical protein JSW35_10540 [Deltaproteobacteria bacterium]
MNTTNPILFVADSMLGKLARYLRIMGYDTFYQSSYSGRRLSELVMEGRTLLTRNHAIVRSYSNAIFIEADLVKDQLKAVDSAVGLTRDQRSWFSRCLICNSPLSKAKAEVAREHVPDFVFLNYHGKILSCPSCKRFYWPGTHRERTLERLKDWGF